MPDTPNPRKQPFDTDFFELALQQEEERKRRMFEAELAAKAPKVTEQDLAQAESRGYAAGVNDGRQQAEEAFARDVQSHLARLLDGVAQIESMKAELTQHIEAMALQTLRVMLGTLVGQAAEKFPDEVLRGVLQKSIAHIHTDLPIKVRLNPASVDFVRGIAGAEPALQRVASQLRFVPDASIALGDCRLEWDTGGINVRLRQSVAEVDRLLVSALAPSPLTPPPSEDPPA